MDASVGRRARAKFSYKALYEADLAVRKGEIVEVVEVVVAGQWWRIRKSADAGGTEGNAPMAYFDLLDDQADVEEPLAPPPPPIQLATRPSTSDKTAPNSRLGSGSPARAPDAQTSLQATAEKVAADDRQATARTSSAREDVPEPIYSSLKDRMAALNGRGLAGAAPAGQTPTGASARTATGQGPSLARPGQQRPASGATAPPGVGSMRLSHKNPGPGISEGGAAVPSLPPRLPPRGPSRRPSSQAASSTDIAEPVQSTGTSQPPTTSVVAAGALRKPPPIPTERPPPPAVAPPASRPPEPASTDRPPPPPRRQPGLGPPTAMPKAPPRPATPPPLTFTLTVPLPQARELSAAELDLGSAWFSRQPLALPDSLLSLPHATLAAGGQFSGDGRGPSELKLGILHGDRSRSFVRIGWGAGVAPSAPRVTQQQTAPPRPRTVAELETAAEQYGERVAAWAESREGSVVGRGECWDLADHALKAVSASLISEHGGDPSAGLAEAIGISFGEVVNVNVDGVVNWGPERRIRRGDILQFVHATFKSFFSDGSTTTSTAGNPTTGHTAVVVADWSGRAADPVIVLQANVGGEPRTRPGEFSLGDLVSGEVRAFRPMASAWYGGPVRPAP